MAHSRRGSRYRLALFLLLVLAASPCVTSAPDIIVDYRCGDTLASMWARAMTQLSGGSVAPAASSVSCSLPQASQAGQQQPAASPVSPTSGGAAQSPQSTPNASSPPKLSGTPSTGAGPQSSPQVASSAAPSGTPTTGAGAQSSPQVASSAAPSGNPTTGAGAQSSPHVASTSAATTVAVTTSVRATASASSVSSVSGGGTSSQPSGSPQPSGASPQPSGSPPPPPLGRRMARGVGSVVRIRLPAGLVPFYDPATEGGSLAFRAPGASLVVFEGNNGGLSLGCPITNLTVLLEGNFQFSNMTFVGCGNASGHWWSVQPGSSVSFLSVQVRQSHAWVSAAAGAAVTIRQSSFDGLSSNSDEGILVRLDGNANAVLDTIAVTSFSSSSVTAGSGLVRLADTSTLSAIGCTFDDGNFAPTSMQAIVPTAPAAGPGGGPPQMPVPTIADPLGGVLCARDSSNATFVGCTFSNLNVPGSGGVLVVKDRATVKVTGGVARSVTAPAAGFASLLNSATLRVDGLSAMDLTVNGTMGLFHGGFAVVQDRASLSVQRASFRRLKAAGNGGAVYASCLNCSVTLDGVLAIGCSAVGSGGVVHADANSTLTVRGGNFQNCDSSTSGGAIMATQSAVTVKDAVFTRCSAGGTTGFGGAVAIANANGASVVRTQFAMTSASDLAGALCLDNSTNSLVDTCTFLGSEVRVQSPDSPHMQGAGVVVRGGDATLSNLTFQGGYAEIEGGALAAIDGAQVKVTNSAFFGTHAGVRGGAIYAQGDRTYVNVAQCDFQNTGAGGTNLTSKSALTGGGAISVFLNARASVDASRFRGTQSTDNGGAVFVGTGGSMNATNSNFTDITCSPGGDGAVAALTVGAVLVMRNCNVNGTVSFYQPLSPADGGSTGSVGAVASTLTGTPSTPGGGIVRAELGSYFEASGCTFHNLAVTNGAGGVVALFGKSTAVVRSTRVGRAVTTKGSGGGFGFATQASTMTISDVHVDYCKSIDKGQGGFVYATEDANVYITRVTVNYTSADTGGFLSTGGGTTKVFVNSTTVQTIDATDGGLVVVMQHGWVDVRNVSVTSIRANQGGIALVNDEGQATLSDINVVASSVDLFGAIVAMTRAAIVDVSRVNVTTASAGSSGGCFRADCTTCVLTARTINVGTSKATSGGVVYLTSSANASLTDVTVDSVSVLGSGGTISLSTRAALEMRRVFIGTTSANVGGGFASLDDASTASLYDVVLGTSSAAQVGGVFALSARAHLTVRTLSVNTLASAGTHGGLLQAVEASSADMDGVTVASVSAGADGGLVKLTVSASAVMSNVNAQMINASGSGGVAYLQDVATANFSMLNVGSSNAIIGGAFLCSGGHVTMDRATFGTVAGPSEGGFAKLRLGCKANVTSLSVTSVADVKGDDAEIFKDDAIYGNGGAWVVVGNGTRLNLNGAYFGHSRTATGVGGFLAIYNSAEAALTKVTVDSASAQYGGALYMARSSSVTLLDVWFKNATADVHGGCFFVSKSTLRTTNVLLDSCVAGRSRAAYGIGGTAYLEKAPKWLSLPTVNVTVRYSTSDSLIGHGIFTALTADTLDSAPTALELSAVATPARATTSPVSFTWTGPAALYVFAGDSLNFTLRMVDRYGNDAVMPPSQMVSVVASLGNDSRALTGDTVKNFDEQSVTFQSLVVHAAPGLYSLTFDSGNRLYTMFDPPFSANAQIPVTVVAGCPNGKTYKDDAGGKGPSCEFEASVGPAQSSSDLTTIVPATVVPGLLVAALAVVAVRWQVLRYRARKSKEAHLLFLEKHLAPRREEFASMEIDRGLIQMQEKLGEGEFGVVHKARLILNGRPRICACKSLKEGATFEERIEFLAEAEIMKGVTNENVVSLCGIVTKDEPMLILLEFVPHGSLRQFVRDLPEETRANDVTLLLLAHFARQAADGMAFLSSINIVHRDLAARNVMVGQDAFGGYIVKIADFGMSRQTEENFYVKKSKRGKIPIKWCAPEALKHLRFSEKSDVWSYGVTCWEMYTFGSMTPYPGVANVEVLGYITSGNRLTRPDLCPEAVYEVMRACWLEDPEQRPTFTRISTLISEFIALEEEHVEGNGMGDGTVSVDMHASSHNVAGGAYVKPFSIGERDYDNADAEAKLQSDHPYEPVTEDDPRYARRPSEFAAFTAKSSGNKSPKSPKGTAKRARRMSDEKRPEAIEMTGMVAGGRRKSKDTSEEDGKRRPSAPMVAAQRRKSKDDEGAQGRRKSKDDGTVRSPGMLAALRKKSRQNEEIGAPAQMAAGYLDLSGGEAGPSSAAGRGDFYLVVNEVPSPSHHSSSGSVNVEAVPSPQEGRSGAASPYVEVYSDEDERLKSASSK